MTDLERFEAFFKEMGVLYSKRDHYQNPYADEATRASKTVLSVTQNHFHFDNDQRFLGSEADEMGYFIAREP